MTTTDKIQQIINDKNSLIAALNSKGFNIATNTKLAELIDIVTDSGITAEKKTVNFYDYDGTLLHSYTRDEALALTELPGLPDRTSEGLTCQGWNWSLSDIQSELTNREDLDYLAVGTNYITTDGATHINITFADKYRNVMPLMFAGDVTIDWGDGVTESVNHESATTITHEYAIAQLYPVKYTIKLTVNSGELTFGGGSGYNICGSTTDDASSPAKAYSSRIDSVFIGNGVESIGGYAFFNCYSLVSISIPDSVTSISERAFDSCYSLASVTIPVDVSSIGSFAFFNCYSLASISIPNSVTSISNSAFYGCYSLTTVTIPNGVKSIGDNAFYYCNSLASVTIPNGVTSIGGSAFYGCSSLVSLTIPNSVKSIGNTAFINCYSLVSISIPSGVTSIGNSAFSGCYSLASISIPDDVSSIGSFAFSACRSLASVTIPNIVTSIGQYAFQNCSSLASIAIPSDVSSIGNSAFNQCYGIIKYDFSTHTSIPTLGGTTVFNGIADDAKIVVPDALYDEWIAADNWSTYASKIVKASEYVEP